MHAFVDGHPRLIVGIHIVDNNRADTVLQLFKAVVTTWGSQVVLEGTTVSSIMREVVASSTQTWPQPHQRPSSVPTF